MTLIFLKKNMKKMKMKIPNFAKFIFFREKKHIDGILKHNLHKLTNSRVPAPYSFPYMTPNVEPPTSFS